ncbi:Rrf2 family transcriptional regulator [Sphingobacterium spiritivorum]|uniref:Rrf2 family transcriptional regulator n=1 Tax=Sphingobacterium spiritivorum TaxID=258 RepID=UPI003DA26B51
MFSNLHFATATHIIALLMLERDTWLSSDYIAGSININPVVVRKEITKLKEAQLVISKEGKNGGVRIAEDIKKKTLADVYKATLASDEKGKYNNPNPNCPVGKNINNYLTIVYNDIEEQHIAYLNQISIQDLSSYFKNK